MTLSTRLDDRNEWFDFGRAPCGCRIGQDACAECEDEHKCRHGVGEREWCSACQEADDMAAEVAEDMARDDDAGLDDAAE